MKNIRNNKGASALLITLVLAVALLILILSVGNDFNSLNKATGDLREYTTEIGVTYDMGQILMTAYQKAKATTPASPAGAPPACDGLSTDTHPEGSTTIHLCIPNSFGTTNFCSQSNDKYCLANPLQMIVFNGAKPDYIVSVKYGKTYSHRGSGFLLFVNQAFAVAPAPYLPDIPAGPTSLTIAVPSCNALATQECIRCGVNADCVKVRICSNGSSTCATGGGQYIEPVFAFQTSYTP